MAIRCHVLSGALACMCLLLAQENQLAQHTDTTCSIDLAEAGNTKRISIELLPGDTYTDSEIGEWSFVQRTNGPCHFQLFNETRFRGKHVTIGSNIIERVRIGKQGFTNRFRGGGDTWRSRSIRISRPDSHGPESCVVRLAAPEGVLGQAVLGGVSVTMDVYDSISDLPYLNFVREASGRNCRYSLHSGAAYGGLRYKYFFPGIDSWYPVGYYVQSIEIKSWTQEDCPLRADTGSASIPLGRCLPMAALPAYFGSEDRDHDSVDDRVESWMAQTFSPIVIYDSDQAPKSNPESPKLLYQVNPLDGGLNELRLSGVLLWRDDLGYGPSSSCSEKHSGDWSGLIVKIKRLRSNYYAPVAVELWHHAHWEDGKAWDTSWGDGGNNRGFDFYGTRVRVFLSAHKHHQYTDTGWNHQDSAYAAHGCNDDVDGLGRVVSPSYHNVGNRSYRLVNSPHEADPNLFDYNFWTSEQKFCGARDGAAFVGALCSGPVLRDKPLAADRCVEDAWCPAP